MYRLRIKYIHTKHFSLKRKFEVLVIPVAIENLLYLTPSHANGNFFCTLSFFSLP